METHGLSRTARLSSAVALVMVCHIKVRPLCVAYSRHPGRPGNNIESLIHRVAVVVPKMARNSFTKMASEMDQQATNPDGQDRMA
jgi:hypothetical protein